MADLSLAYHFQSLRVAFPSRVVGPSCSILFATAIYLAYVSYPSHLLGLSSRLLLSAFYYSSLIYLRHDEVSQGPEPEEPG